MNIFRLIIGDFIFDYIISPILRGLSRYLAGYRAHLEIYKEYKSNDPVYDCNTYKKIGCSHVDGMLCDFPKCDMQDMEIPVECDNCIHQTTKKSSTCDSCLNFNKFKAK